MSAAPLELRVYNQSLRDELIRFHRYLIEQLRNRLDIPVAEILARLPFGPMGGTTREELLARGSIRVLSEDRLQNSGEEFFGNFQDSKLGEVAVYFPEDIDASFQAARDTFSVSFDPPIECVIHALTDLIGDLRRSAYQYLYQLNAAGDTWSYLLSTQGDDNETLNLIIDASGSGFRPSTSGFLLPDVAKPPRFAGSCCLGAKQTEVINVRTGPIRSLPLHFRRLVEPSSHTIEEMVAALDEIFQESGVPVRADVRSNSDLSLPDLEVVDFPPGECPESIDDGSAANSSQTEGLCLISGDSEEADQLYGNRDGVPNDELCFFIVTDINKPCDPIGRAIINGPSGMLEADCLLYTLAHEVGHTLGLNHHEPPISGALMNSKLVANQPSAPKFLEKEHGTILSSPFVKRP
jgi:hypothetical protein